MTMYLKCSKGHGLGVVLTLDTYCTLPSFPYLWSPGLYKKTFMSTKSGHVWPVFFAKAWHASNAQYNRAPY